MEETIGEVGKVYIKINCGKYIHHFMRRRCIEQ